MLKKYENINVLNDVLNNLDDKKSHILITGDINSGKSTLLNHFIYKNYFNHKIKVHKTEINYINNRKVLTLNSGDGLIEIATWTNNIPIFNEKLFINKSFEIFSNFNKGDIIFFDEIGLFEINLTLYVNKLINIFNEHRVFAVLKKKGNPIFNNLNHIGSYILFDLDEYYIDTPHS